MQHPAFLCVLIIGIKNQMLELSAPIQVDELVERCRQGDRRSYGELYNKYSRAMYNTSLRIVSHTADAEDVLQESFVDAFAAIDSFAYKSTFGAWMKRIVINKSINALRKRKMDIIDIDKTGAAHLPEEEQYNEEELKFKVEEIKKAVKELPNGYRTVISLHLFEGYDQEEIAEILQISHTTVRTQYMRAKQKLLLIIKQGGLS
ncbi:MAG: RNA polymerase sigma factor [Bacteroidota bacterium]|nr:RNA polymerase sigma factor [Bacteroidota bacterium]